MRYSQVEKLDRASYLSNCRYARKKVSCTTSSASSSFPVMRNARRKMARLCCSTSSRNASLSPDRARSTAPPASTSIRPLDYGFSNRLGGGLYSADRGANAFVRAGPPVRLPNTRKTAPDEGVGRSPGTAPLGLNSMWLFDIIDGMGLELAVSEEAGVRFVEGPPDLPLMRSTEDATLLVEACFSHRAKAALLYPPNLTQNFFDLSSGEAGAILQKLRNYR